MLRAAPRAARAIRRIGWPTVAIALAGAALLAILADPIGSPTAAAATANVAIQGFAFSPAQLTVNPGDTVTWTNRDQGVPHTVHANNGRFDSPTLATNASFSFSFQASDAGTISYYCTIHPSMRGSITVAGSAATATSTSTIAPTSTPVATPTTVPTSTPAETQPPAATVAATPPTPGTPGETPAPASPTPASSVAAPVVVVTPLPAPNAPAAAPRPIEPYDPPLADSPASALLPDDLDVPPGLHPQLGDDWRFGGDGFTGAVRRYARIDVDPAVDGQADFEVSVVLADSPQRASQLYRSTLRAFAALGYHVSSYPTAFGDETAGGFRDAGVRLPAFIYFRSGPTTGMIRWEDSADPANVEYALQLAAAVSSRLAG